MSASQTQVSQSSSKPSSFCPGVSWIAISKEAEVYFIFSTECILQVNNFAEQTFLEILSHIILD